jgi:menaquinone-dependent protoporphyrinogen oxidase
MADTILVAYASRTGTTADISEEIGSVLDQNGLSSVVLPMQQVQDLTPYRAVIAGSAIQSGAWLPEAMSFIETHQSMLKDKPFAAFLVCMTLAMPNKAHHQHVQDWLTPVRTMVPTIREGFFAGQLDISKVPSLKDRLMFRLSVLMGVWSESDHRDWDKVRTWTEDLVEVLS